MSKWIKPPKRYGGKEDNEAFARQYPTQQEAERREKERKINNITKFCKIAGYIVTVLGIISMGISILCPISCLGTGFIVTCIGLCMLWGTESIC